MIFYFTHLFDIFKEIIYFLDSSHLLLLIFIFIAFNIIINWIRGEF